MPAALPLRVAATALLAALCSIAHAQFPTWDKNPYLEHYRDSLKNMDYPYHLPLLGKQAYKKGFDIPYPVGVMVNYYSQTQEVLINKVEVGIDDKSMYDVSSLVQFGEIKGTTHSVTFRPDVWLLPFLNVYGVFGQGVTHTEVSLVKPFPFTTTQRLAGSSMGVGVTLAGSVGPVVVIVDQNMNWADLDAFTEPVPAYNLGIRIGHNFVNERRPDRNVVIWAGPFMQRVRADTEGRIAMSSLFGDLSPGDRLAANEDLQVWYDDLGPLQQVTVDQVVDRVSGYLTNLADSEIHYKIDKSAKQEWNLILGAQYQFNKKWQLRSEMGAFGSRSQFLLSLNYRFQL